MQIISAKIFSPAGRPAASAPLRHRGHLGAIGKLLDGKDRVEPALWTGVDPDMHVRHLLPQAATERLETAGKGVRLQHRGHPTLGGGI